MPSWATLSVVTWILMHHPETGGVARTTERAFTLAHEPQGWKRIDPDKVTKNELLAAADQLGVPVRESESKATIASTIAGADKSQED